MVLAALREGRRLCLPLLRSNRQRRLSLVSVISLLVAGWSAMRAAEIRWLVATEPNAVEVSGVSQDTLQAWHRRDAATKAFDRVLEVFAEDPDVNAATKLTMPPMAGLWRVESERLRFEPKFPLVPGVRYRAEYRVEGDAPVVSYFELPARLPGRPTEVAQIYPSADVLPENQLKFYVHFSAPMGRGGVYQHVHVRDAAGTAVDLPFLDLDEELWDPSMTRLTLLIDPGRIKRGVKPLEDIGPVFEEGKTYSLTLDARCRDATGQPLRETYEKKFRVGPADRTAPDPQRWQIAVPKAGTRAPVVVTFDEPMDHALALRLIRIEGAKDGKASVRGDGSLGNAERVWSFVPSEPWTRGNFWLVVATTIEDLAGNNIGKTFDVDLSAGASRRVVGESVSVAFKVE